MSHGKSCLIVRLSEVRCRSGIQVVGLRCNAYRNLHDVLYIARVWIIAIQCSLDIRHHNGGLSLPTLVGSLSSSGIADVLIFCSVVECPTIVAEGQTYPVTFIEAVASDDTLGVDAVSGDDADLNGGRNTWRRIDTRFNLRAACK